MNSVVRAWEQVLRRDGGRRAVIDAATGTVATFRDLDAAARAWAADHVAGTLPVAGRAVVFAAPNGPDWFAIFLALLRAGSIPVPLDAAEPVPGQRQLAAALRASHWWNEGRMVPLPRPRRYLDRETCLIKLTSGTTGRPRPLVFTSGQMLADGRQVMTTMGITRADLNYALVPLGHSYGLGNLTLPLIAGGVALVLGSAPLPHAIAADFARWRPTVFPSVPPLWRALASSPVRLASLRLAISAGAPLPPETARAFAQGYGKRLHGFYGSSETGGIAFDRTGGATLTGGVGRALRGVRLAVGPAGRLEVASAAVFTLGNRRRSGAHGAWVMADRVARDARGGLVILGRRGRTVKIAGRRLNLGEVVAAIRGLPGVRDAWVGTTPGPEPVLGTVVATDATAGDLRPALGRVLAPWKIPRRWRVLGALPLTSRGKPDPRALQAMAFGPA